MTIQFDHTIGVIRKDGTKVLTNSLSKGEKLSATGETYAQVVKRMGGETIGIPAQPAEESPVVGQALTLEPTGVSTVLAKDVPAVEEVIEAHIEATLNGDGTIPAKEDNSKTVTTVATVDDEGSSTKTERKAPAKTSTARKAPAKKK